MPPTSYVDREGANASSNAVYEMEDAVGRQGRTDEGGDIYLQFGDEGAFVVEKSRSFVRTDVDVAGIYNVISKWQCRNKEKCAESTY